MVVILLISLNGYACELELFNLQKHLDLAERRSLESDAISIAKVTGISKIHFGDSKGKYKITFTVNNMWSRQDGAQYFKELKGPKKIKVEMHKSYCNGLPVEKGELYWLFTKNNEHVSQFHVFYSRLYPRDLSGFRSEQ
jgi:hypothetical protein